MKSWIFKNVKIKDEYLEVSEDGKVSINAPVGVEFYDVEIKREHTVKVLYDCYGIDLYEHQVKPLNIEDKEPVHLLIVDGCKYPYMWDAKYFELVD